MSPSISAEACAQRIADAKQLDDTALGIKRSHGGRIKTRLANKSNTVLWITLGVLVAVTIFTFIIMDYGKIPMAQAVPAAFEDFFTMLTQPWLVNHFTMEDVIRVFGSCCFDHLYWCGNCLLLWFVCCYEFV